MQGLLVRVANIFEAASEAAAEGDAEAAALLKASNSVLGAAIKSLGPQDVLKILPLNLEVSILLYCAGLPTFYIPAMQASMSLPRKSTFP